MEIAPPSKQRKPSVWDPFRRAVLRGLGVLLPPLLTVVIFLWIGNTVANYLLDPMEAGVRRLLVNHYEDRALPASRTPDGDPVEGIFLLDSQPYRRLASGEYVPVADYSDALEYIPGNRIPETSQAFYRTYVDRKFLPWYTVVPVFTCLFVLLLYLLGKFLAAGVGRFFWLQFERFINRLPLVRNVYSSVKQVTDFMFNERELEYTRVVAVEYPRKGIWSLAMVTGESLHDIACAANEPVVSLLVPTSPMPFTGFTITVRKSEIVDLNITVDQAFQFIVSCGVVSPPGPSGASRSSLQLPPTEV